MSPAPIATRDPESAHECARARRLLAAPCVARTRGIALAVSLAAHALVLAVAWHPFAPSRASERAVAEIHFDRPAEVEETWTPPDAEPPREPDVARDIEEPRLVESELPIAELEERVAPAAPTAIVAVATFDVSRATRGLRIPPLARHIETSVTESAEVEAPPVAVEAARFEPARPLACPAPRYPRASIARGESGTVLLRIDVAADGSVVDVHVATSSGFARLDEAAEDAAYAWTFAPARLGGVAVASKFHHRVTFELRT